MSENPPVKRKKSTTKARRPTVLDIAREAHVSPATVSRVLGDADYPVTNELRERVHETARRLNYKPNIYGQMLKGGGGREIGIIVPDLINPFYAQLVSAVARHCLTRGYAPIVCCSYGSPEQEDRQLDILLRQQVGGILLSSIGQNSALIEKLAEPGAPPVVLFDQSVEGFEGDCVSFDFHKGGFMAASYLIQCGHRKIAFVSHALDRGSRRQIYDGYCEALEKAGIPLNPDMVLIHPAIQSSDDGDVDFQNGRLLTRMLLECGELPDAVMAINDITAIGIMDALHQQGVRIPRDLSVIGFDDIPISAMVRPALTTIRQPAVETGARAVELLFRRIDEPELEPERMIIEPELVVRQSVKKLRGTQPR